MEHSLGHPGFFRTPIPTACGGEYSRRKDRKGADATRAQCSKVAEVGGGGRIGTEQCPMHARTNPSRLEQPSDQKSALQTIGAGGVTAGSS